MSSNQDDQSYLSAPSPNPSNNSSNETFIDPSPIAPSSNGTEFADLDEVVENQNGDTKGITTAGRTHTHPAHQPELTVCEDSSIDRVGTSSFCLKQIKTSTPARLVPFRPKSDEDEAPQSVIHAPPGFSDFV
jgi:hypothetical protein